MDMFAPIRASVPLVDFQEVIVSNMVNRLRQSGRPILLRSPTGSGKTMMIGRALNDLVRTRPMLWFWFVPYVNLVTQTMRSIEDHCASLRPAELIHGRRFDHQAGDVLAACVKTVASSEQIGQVYSPKSEQVPAFWELVSSARASGLKIGIVVDEAHIGLSSETEFGKFCVGLNPDNIIMATATPRDRKLMDFLAAADYPDYETFTVSRDQVVAAKLNKRYVAAIVYETTETWQLIADFTKTALRQAWRQHQVIRDKLAKHDIKLTPLMLVQVANGDHTTGEALDYLVRDCQVPMELIRSYEGKDNDPTALQRYAADPTCQVLIFKEAAGTGFDAPRAFVLASVKPVSDVDFAAQFIGRIMRVARPVREYMEENDDIDPDLETGYVFLANATAQSGFETAAHDMLKMKSSIEGAIERLHERRLVDGSKIYSNRPTDQPSLLLSSPFVRRSDVLESIPSAREIDPSQISLFSSVSSTAVSEPSTVLTSRLTPMVDEVRSVDSLKKGMVEREFELHTRQTHLPKLPRAFQTEQKPRIEDLKDVVRWVVRHLDISDVDIMKAAMAVYSGPIAKQVTTNLETMELLERSDVGLVLDRTSLAADVQDFIARLPQSSSADSNALIRAMSERMSVPISDWYRAFVPVEFRSDEAITRISRDAVYVLLRSMKADVLRLFNEEIAKRVVSISASSLPDAMIFPSEIALKPSIKNIYGVFPPNEEQIRSLYSQLIGDERQSLRRYAVEGSDEGYFVDAFDHSWQMNQSEELFARRLDRASFVDWWTRNPSRKPYSAAVVRADNGYNFYPDFIVCVRYWEEDDSAVRLIETKFDVTDAVAKGGRPSLSYGKVIFLRTDHESQTLKIINDDGSLGREVGGDLERLRDVLRSTS
ncbi:DEAD/DEAH box helicase [Rhizobium rhododendri]|uniref:DEAD/DEAH box helicase family protein n=1 Tax=Rhizobium rhododendri TaxID=2506430 RepID=A0ABY8IJN3_9HYPH|nr:DEAD/DEAH box helicase family protein [Rhizobium rhododendri]WFS23922.1 DEAD/DEAH box helicase family protein [Rhizobium rhododendri]